MQTDCSADLFGFAAVEGREVVASFDAGSISSDTGRLIVKADHLDGEQTSTLRHGRSPRHSTGCQRPRQPSSSRHCVDGGTKRGVGTPGASPSSRTRLPMAPSRDWAPAALHPTSAAWPVGGAETQAG